jgi:Excalibur calcium-binding domain
MTSRRKSALIALSVLLATGVGVGVGTAAQAASRTYADCASMHRVYANGAAKSSSAAAHPSPSWIKIKPPAVDSGAYTANRKLDRDNDGIACEVAK